MLFFVCLFFTVFLFGHNFQYMMHKDELLESGPWENPSLQFTFSAKHHDKYGVNMTKIYTIVILNLHYVIHDSECLGFFVLLPRNEAQSVSPIPLRVRGVVFMSQMIYDEA